MATYEEAIKALRAADAAGNVEDAKRLAVIAQRLKQQPQPEPAEFSTKEMVSNIPSSALGVAEAMVQPIIHPIDTAQAVGNLTLGGLSKADKYISDIPFIQNLRESMQPLMSQLQQQGQAQPLSEFEPYADQFNQFISDRYGSVESFKKTVQEDPVGVLADIATVISVGSVAPGTAGRVASKTARALDPLNVVKAPVKAAVRKSIPKNLPFNMYDESAKFPTSLPAAKRKAIIDTALEYGITPNRKGLARLGTVAADFGEKIDSLIQAADASGQRIPVRAVFTRLKELRKEMGSAKLEGAADVRKINGVAKRFANDMRRQRKQSFSPSELQKFKEDIYNKINFDAINKRSNLALDNTRKAIAKSAKEAIEKVADVRDFNRELGRLLSLKKRLDPAAARIERSDVFGMNTAARITAGSIAGGPAGTAVGVGASVLEAPKIKAAIAVKLAKIQRNNQTNLIDPRITPTLVRLGLFQTGRVEEENGN